ncbi:hypothetical protein D3C80_1957800 [compost metagenome]
MLGQRREPPMPRRAAARSVWTVLWECARPIRANEMARQAKIKMVTACTFFRTYSAMLRAKKYAMAT